MSQPSPEPILSAPPCAPADPVQWFNREVNPPPRQLDFAQLMVATNNYTNGYAQALLLGTSTEMLVRPEKPKVIQGLKAEDVAQMEKEMEILERDFKVYQNSYGENALTLNVVQRCVKRLVENTQIKRFLGKRYPEIQEELADLAGMELL